MIFLFSEATARAKSREETVLDMVSTTSNFGITPLIIVPYRVADTAKQALGMLEMHFVNIAISAQFREKECTS